MGVRDYALSEIARIVEDADGKILSLYVTQDPEGSSLHLTLKLNRSDLQPVVRGFERFGYKVSAEYGAELPVDETARRNYESLLKYLSV